MRKQSILVTFKLICMLIISFMIVIPFYYLVVTTFKSSTEAAIHPMSLPQSWSLQPYIDAFKQMNYISSFGNTLFITFFSVAGIVVVSSMGGYVLYRRAKNPIFGRIFLIILAGMMFPHQMSIMGLYKVIQALHLVDTRTSIVLINIAINIPFATLMYHSFMQTVPISLEESAKIDGATFFQTFRKIVFPLLKPTTATIVILDTLTIWNDFMNPLYFIQSRSKNVILQEVYRNVGQFSTDWTSMFPMMILGILPLLIFYIFMQKHVISGVMNGSLK